ncbi:hypothetical protein OA93_20935 [Flavobacterium sp. KMS]|uniref:hypothetical protein n=1 Tax=Flavobacterium sp. KMS TaxID=1566023 RepID=UPI0005805CCE|nr:hypothetical protein [Flavobacterium sp. KMS]KIA93927.1 hypothetical protein OA93_20935 [Flavobacterium sp. KMS]
MTTNINTILGWFKTGKKPTQTQFWASWQSFWHKDEMIPQSSITNLVSTLDAKVEKSQFETHKSDKIAHADLFETKEDKAQKGLADGYAPLDSFAKLTSQYLDIVNDLVSGGSNSLLSAEQGVVLQNQIKSINILLASDNINLDTLQKIVNAIEAVQVLLSTILVNDLTTGGTTKALTAEMGKTLKVLIDSLTTIISEKEPLITGGETGQYYDYNKTWQSIPTVDISGKQDIVNQIEVGTSQPAQVSWQGKTVIFTASCTITIPVSLIDSYIFNGITLPGVTINWVITTPNIWLFGTPSATTEKQIFTLTKRGSTNSILLLGV